MCGGAKGRAFMELSAPAQRRPFWLAVDSLTSQDVAFFSCPEPFGRRVGWFLLHILLDDASILGAECLLEAGCEVLWGSISEESSTTPVGGGEERVRGQGEAAHLPTCPLPASHHSPLQTWATCGHWWSEKQQVEIVMSQAWVGP